MNFFIDYKTDSLKTQKSVQTMHHNRKDDIHFLIWRPLLVIIIPNTDIEIFLYIYRFSIYHYNLCNPIACKCILTRFIV